MSGTLNTGIRAVVHRELCRMISRPLYLLLALVLPLLAFGFFWVIFQQGIPRNLPVAILDEDQSMFSRKITRMIDATASMQVTEEVASLLEGKSLLRSVRCYALIVLPRDLERDALSGKAPGVINFYNNQFLLTGSIINRDVRRAIGTISAGMDLRRRQKQGDMTAVALAHLEPIHTQSEVLFNPYVNYSYFLTGTLNPTMLQIFVLVLSVYVLGIELKEGTAGEWLNVAGGSPGKAILGKLLPYTLVFIFLGLFMNFFHFRYIGAPLRGSGTFIALSTIAFVLAYQAVALFLVSVTSNLRLALSMSAFYSSTAFAFVGMTFPILAMPTIARTWGAVLPLTYYIRIFVDQTMRGTPLFINLPDLMALVFFIFVLPLLAMLRMPGLMIESKYWGRI